MCRLLHLMLLWFPQRSFVFVGDAGYGSHEVARFCYRHRRRLTLVSKLHPDANLYEPPPPYAGKGRPRQKGAKLPKPRQAATAATLWSTQVGWYGGGRRQVKQTSGLGRWYKAGAGLVPIRWVFVRDETGSHREEYFFTTDPAWTPTAIITAYTSRWNIETTFQELRAYLGLETTQGWCPATVLRLAPCLFGLYTTVAVLYATLPESKRSGSVAWPGKQVVTFSDALTAVRRWLWTEGIFPQVQDGTAMKEIPASLREIIFSALAPAA